MKMTIRKTFLSNFILGAVTAIGIGLSSPALTLAQDVTLKMHQFLPANANAPKLVLDVWAKRVEQDSGGRIQIDHYPSMQLGGRPPELVDQVVNGVADIIWTVVGYTPGRFPSTEVFELPFMMKDVGALSCAFWTMFEKHMKDTEFADMHILGTWVHGPGVIHTEDPVEEIADLKGMKIRGGSRVVNQLLEQVGATPVGMPVPAVPESLAKGVLNGTTIPWEVTTSLKVPDLVENHTEFEGAALYTLTFIMAMNKEKYASLPADLKAVIDKNSGLEFSVFAGRTQAGQDGPARQLAIDNGNNIITLRGDKVAQWQQTVQPIYQRWIADMNEKGLDGAALVAEARASQDSCMRALGS